MKIFKSPNTAGSTNYSGNNPVPDINRNGILIVDDSRFSRNVLKDILIKENYEVVGEAGDGLQAIELAKKLHPEYVFMDVEMPKLDGLTAIPRILAHDSGIHIIMCTALGQKKIVYEAAKAGAADYVIKPYNRDNIINVLKIIADANPNKAMESNNEDANPGKIPESNNEDANPGKIPESNNTDANSNKILESSNADANRSKVSESNNVHTNQSRISESANTDANRSRISESANTDANRSRVSESANTNVNPGKISESNNVDANRSKVLENNADTNPGKAQKSANAENQFLKKARKVSLTEEKDGVDQPSISGSERMEKKEAAGEVKENITHNFKVFEPDSSKDRDKKEEAPLQNKVLMDVDEKLEPLRHENRDEVKNRELDDKEREVDRKQNRDAGEEPAKRRYEGLNKEAAKLLNEGLSAKPAEPLKEESNENLGELQYEEANEELERLLDEELNEKSDKKLRSEESNEKPDKLPEILWREESSSETSKVRSANNHRRDTALDDPGFSYLWKDRFYSKQRNTIFRRGNMRHLTFLQYTNMKEDTEILFNGDMATRKMMLGMMGAYLPVHNRLQLNEIPDFGFAMPAKEGVIRLSANSLLDAYHYDDTEISIYDLLTENKGKSHNLVYCDNKKSGLFAAMNELVNGKANRML